MFSEAIRYLSETEEKFRLMKAECAAEGKRRIAEAYAAGEKSVEEAEKRAEEELRALYAAAEEHAKESADSVAHENRESAVKMRNAAERKMADAVSFIVERVVSC